MVSFCLRYSRAIPILSGVLFDLPSGVAAAQQGAGGDLPRTEFVAGDFFESVPDGDIYVIKKVIHDWNDERAVVILRNCRKAMKPNGKVLLAETLVPAGGRTRFDQKYRRGDARCYGRPGEDGGTVCKPVRRRRASA